MSGPEEPPAVRRLRDVTARPCPVPGCRFKGSRFELGLHQERVHGEPQALDGE